jgi:predicted nucleotidyltransferase
VLPRSYSLFSGSPVSGVPSQRKTSPWVYWEPQPPVAGVWVYRNQYLSLRLVDIAKSVLNFGLSEYRPPVSFLIQLATNGLEGNDLNPTIRFAEGIAGRLGNVRGVVAVALGGSWARGEAHPDSDVDLGVYYRPDRPPAVGELRRLAQELDDRHLPDLVTETGEWGPWINGGGWLRVAGRPVDWLYRDAGKVASTIERGISGQTACHYQPGHPHGFHEHIYLGEVFHCHALHDPEGLLRDLKSVVSTYPPKLKRTLVEKYLWEAGFSLEIARKPAARGEASYASGCLFRGVACMVQALFAANECWFLNEKGSVGTVDSFAAKPEGFSEAASRLLGCPGQDAGALAGSVSRYEELLAEVRESCAREMQYRELPELQRLQLRDLQDQRPRQRPDQPHP